MKHLIIDYYNKLIHSSFSNLMYSALCLLFFFLIYFIISKILNKKVEDRFRRKKIKINIRNILLFFLIFILLSFWAGQIKTMLLSTAAITAAVIITFKEVLLSFFASFYITSNKILSIGDEVEYENIKGRVINRNFSGIKVLCNRLDENKVIFIPNIIFLNNKVMNFSKVEDVNINSVSIGLRDPVQAIELAKLLEERLVNELNFNLEHYKSKFSCLNAGNMNDFFTVDKNFYVKKDFSDFAKTKINVYFYAKKEDKEDVENKVFNIYYTFLKESDDGNKSIRSNNQ